MEMALVSKENMRKIKHICGENPNCDKAEHCETAIDCTTIANLMNGEKRYIKGLGNCEYDNEKQRL